MSLAKIVLKLLLRVERLEKKMATTQAQIDALVTELQGDEDKLNTFVAAVTAHDADLQKQIDDLKAANPDLDLTGLQAVADGIGTVIDAAKP